MDALCCGVLHRVSKILNLSTFYSQERAHVNPEDVATLTLNISEATTGCITPCITLVSDTQGRCLELSGDRVRNSVVFALCLPIASHTGGGTHRSLVNTGGLNCSPGTEPGSVGKHGCSPGSWDQTQPREACSLPGSQCLRAVTTVLSFRRK